MASPGWKPLLITSHLAAFQRLMNSILSVSIYHVALVYFDDVIINSLSCELHLKDLHRVLKRNGYKLECVPVLRKTCRFSRTLGFKDYTQTKQSRSHKNLKTSQK